MDLEAQPVVTEQPQPVVGGGKNPHDVRKVAGLLVVVAAIGLLGWAWTVHNKKSDVVKPLSSAATERRDRRPGDKNIALNKAVTTGNIKLTVKNLGVLDSTIAATDSAPEGVLHYVTANVAFEGAADKPGNYSLDQFSLLTDSTTVAALGTASLPLNVGVPLGSGSLKKGEKAEGQVVFLLPKTVKYYYVIFTPQAGSHERLVVTP